MNLKKSILILSSVISVFLLLWSKIGNYAICDAFSTSSSAGSCPEVLTSIGLTLMPLFVLCLFSFLTYKMQIEIYNAWVKFALPWTGLSVLAIGLAPQYGQGGFGPAISIDKGTIAFLMSTIFVTVSILILAARFAILKYKSK